MPITLSIGISLQTFTFICLLIFHWFHPTSDATSNSHIQLPSIITTDTDWSFSQLTLLRNSCKFNLEPIALTVKLNPLLNKYFNFSRKSKQQGKLWNASVNTKLSLLIWIFHVLYSFQWTCQFVLYDCNDSYFRSIY